MTKLSRVVPAVLTEDPQALAAMVSQCEKFTSFIQVDIMDGRFVPSRSITHEHLAALDIEIGWEAHLMVQNPESHVENYQKAGAEKIVFHYEATSSPEKVISITRDLDVKVGLAINPETSVSTVRHLLSEVDSVLLLTVNPGFYGSQFIPEVLDKIAELRGARAGLEIGVDGGIKAGNIAHIARLGADIICVGSAIFLQPQPDASYHNLVALAEEGSRQRAV